MQMAVAPILTPHTVNQYKPAAFPQSEDGLRVSEAVYWEKYYNHGQFNYEWNHGILEKVPVSDYLEYQLYEWFLAILREYLRTHPIGRAIALETGFTIGRNSKGKRAIRKPDLGVVLDNNPEPLGNDDKSYKGTFDLCVESVSTSSRREFERDTIIKKREYANAGVQEYFILDPRKKHQHFYRLVRRGVYRPISPTPDGIIQSHVLPGFQFRLQDLDKRPSLEDMAHDPVYQGFILLDYQRSLQENARFRAKLLAMGIDPDSL